MSEKRENWIWFFSNSISAVFFRRIHFKQMMITVVVVVETNQLNDYDDDDSLYIHYNAMCFPQRNFNEFHSINQSIESIHWLIWSTFFFKLMNVLVSLTRFFWWCDLSRKSKVKENSFYIFPSFNLFIDQSSIVNEMLLLIFCLY